MKAVIGFIAFLFFLHFASPTFAADAAINEFVVDSSPEWVELHNASSSADYLKEYFIDDDENFSDDAGSSGKKSLSNLNITNPSFPYLDLSSSIFNNTGSDFVVLFDGNGNVVDSYSYAQNPGDNISIGRSPDGSGEFFILTSLTKGSANSQPIPTSTPTPTPTPTPSPTQTPSPTPTPTPTKTPIPTPTKIPTPTPTPTLTPKSSITPTSKLLPTMVLGESTQSSGINFPTETQSLKEGILISNETKNSSNWFQKIFIVFGGVLLMACAILFFRFYIKNKKQDSEIL